MLSAEVYYIIYFLVGLSYTTIVEGLVPRVIIV